MTVSNCGEPLRIERPPRRLVVHDLNMTEMALALGLRPALVGVTGITGWYKQPGEALLRTLDGVPELAPRYPTMETLVAARPDLFFAGWYYGMQPGGDVTPATLALRGIQALVLTESCAQNRADKPRATMDLLYGDVLRLGQVFGRTAQAQRLVDGWRARAWPRPTVPRWSAGPVSSSMTPAKTSPSPPAGRPCPPRSSTPRAGATCWTTCP